MTEASTATGGAHDAMFEAVEHDVPTDPVKLRKTQLAHADAAVQAAQAKLEKLTKMVKGAPHGTKTRLDAHLKGAQKALAQAIADKQGIV
jgi:hypothetical protein